MSNALRLKYPSSKSAYRTVCVTNQPAGGASASEFIGKVGHPLAQQSACVPHQLPSQVLRQVKRQSPLSKRLRRVELAYGQQALNELTPKDTLPGVFQKQRQAASSKAFQCMRRRFATPQL